MSARPLPHPPSHTHTLAPRNRCGFDPDASIGVLRMLTNIEIRLEEYLSVAELLPPAEVEAEEKARQKERRHSARCAQRSQADAAMGLPCRRRGTGDGAAGVVLSLGAR